MHRTGSHLARGDTRGISTPAQSWAWCLTLGQQLVDGDGLQTKELGGLTVRERIVAVPQQHGQLDPAPDVHSAEMMVLVWFRRCHC
jgi:hypothetical protein